MTSYQAHFASHHTRDRHVGFLFARHGIGEHNKMSGYFLLSSHTINDNDMLSYSLTTMMCFLTKE